MERIFQAVGSDYPENVNINGTPEDTDTTDHMVRALIADAVDYNNSYLSPLREQAIKYYEGIYPSLEEAIEDRAYDSHDDTPEDADLDANRSRAVSTDVRDTVLAIMPSLIRIFTSSEHVVTFVPNSPDKVTLASQQTDYIEKIFWEDNEGFLLLHDVFKDALTQKIGVVMWWTEHEPTIRQKRFEDVPVIQIANAIDQYNQTVAEGEYKAELVDYKLDDNDQNFLEYAEVRYYESMPRHRIETVPPEEFRIDRRARTVKSARLVGRHMLATVSDVVKRGVPLEVANEYRGSNRFFAVEASLRNPAIDMALVAHDLVEWGEYFIRYDEDGDGIDELHFVRVIGNNYTIVDDEIVDEVRLAVFCGDPRPHTPIGDSMADLTMDIQRINTQILRGSLDSLSASMFSDYAINDTTTNIDDVMADGVGKIIRVKGDPNAAVKEYTKTFVGNNAFMMLTTMDGIRQRRTGISEASKGIDPKALQSTNQMGVEAIVTGAQERIELIARIFAETGFKAMFQGLLREVCDYPNHQKSVLIRGDWQDIDVSLFDPNLGVKVNPTMGKGSDMNRLMALQSIKQDQLMIMEKFGPGNPVVTPKHVMNTIEDMMAIANIKDITRYFTPMTDQQIAAMQQAPKEPSPEEKIATAELEKVKSQTATELAKAGNADRKMRMEDDFRRDKLTLDTLAKIAVAMAKTDMAKIDTALPTIHQENQP